MVGPRAFGRLLLQSSLSVISLLALLWLPTASIAQEPVETVASTFRWTLDPEFNRARGEVVWIDNAGSIWLAGVDPLTGAFIPADGKGLLIHFKAAPAGDLLKLTLNGPEWAFSAGGDMVVYTTFPAGQTPDASGARVSVARLGRDGTWSKSLIEPRSPRNGPYGSERPSDASPSITYVDDLGNHIWRDLSRSGVEIAIPDIPSGNFPVTRFARDQRAPLYLKDVDGVRQVFRWNIDTRMSDQLTSDAGDKNDPRMWNAPEFGNEPALILTLDKHSMQVYRTVRDPNGATSLSLHNVITAPDGGAFSSTEPFIYQGKSYVVMQMAFGDYPNSIWLAGIDPAEPLFRRLTPTTPERARNDPEVYITDSGPIVYFSRWDPSKGSYWVCSKCLDGLYRVETGL